MTVSLHLESDLSPGQSFTVINKKGKTKVLILQVSSILKLPLRLTSSGQSRLWFAVLHRGQQIRDRLCGWVH